MRRVKGRKGKGGKTKRKGGERKREANMSAFSTSSLSSQSIRSKAPTMGRKGEEEGERGKKLPIGGGERGKEGKSEGDLDGAGADNFISICQAARSRRQREIEGKGGKSLQRKGRIEKGES